MSAEDCNIWLWEQARKAAKEWNIQQCLNVYADLYLYFRRGCLTVAETCPEGFTLGHSKRIGPSGTAEQVMHWIHNEARHLPCLPEGA